MFKTIISVLALLALASPLASAHGDHNPHIQRNYKRGLEAESLIKRATTVQVPQSLNLTNSSLTYLAQSKNPLREAYAQSIGTPSAAELTQALQTYQQLVTLFGFVPNVT